MNRTVSKSIKGTTQKPRRRNRIGRHDELDYEPNASRPISQSKIQNSKPNTSSNFVTLTTLTVDMIMDNMLGASNL